MLPNHFELHYEGKSTENHSMDISVTKDILSALETLISTINKRTGSEEEINLEVQAFKEGSFGIEIALLADNALSSLEILSTIGIGGLAAAHGGVLGYLDWKRNRENVDFIKNEDGSIEVVDSVSGETTRTTAEIIKLSSDSRIKAQLNRILVEPFRKLDLNKVSITNQDITKVSFTRDKVESYSSEFFTEQLDNWTEDLTVTVHHVSLVPEGKWRIHIQGYQNAITAIMLDEDFMNKITDGKVTFKAKDRMIVTLEKQVTRKGERKKNTYSIHEVKKHWHDEKG